MSLYGEAQENYFVNSDGLKLFEQIWFPVSSEIRAMVFLIHGLSEHSSFHYFETVIRPLNQIGCLVASHDHVGHGKSEGNRKVLGKIDNLTRDVIHHVEFIKRKLNISNVPIFVYGHSLGGLIACKISINQPDLIKGMVLEAPALTLNGRNDTGFLYMSLVRLLSFVMPSYVIRKPVFENLTRNKDVIQDALQDSYRNKDGLSLGTAVNLGSGIQSIQYRLNEIKTPFFVVHGSKDAVISSLGSQILRDEAPVEDKLFVEYEGGYHMLRVDSNEICEDFKEKLVEWINQRI